MGGSAFGSQRPIDCRYKIFIFVHTSGTFQLSDHLSGVFRKKTKMRVPFVLHTFLKRFFEKTIFIT